MLPSNTKHSVGAVARQRYVHCLVDLVDGEAGMDGLHGLAGVLQRVQSLLVDVGGLDGEDLLL